MAAPKKYLMDTDYIQDKEVSHKQSHKQLKQRKTLKLPSDAPPDVQKGLLILDVLTRNKNISWNFMNCVDPVGDGAQDYYEVIKKPMWFKKIRENIYARKYTSLKEIVMDIRLVFKNAYFYNGPTNLVSRRALKLENMLEEQLQTLSEDLRQTCTLDACYGNDFCTKVDETDEKVAGSYLLKYAVSERSRADAEKRLLEEKEEELRKQVENNRRCQWEDCISYIKIKEFLRTSWEVPQIGQFLLLASGVLNFAPTSIFELEHMLILPQSSRTLRLLMTTLLSNPVARGKLTEKPPMPYSYWSMKLSSRLSDWFRIFTKEKQNALKMVLDYGLDKSLWEELDFENPLEKKEFHELPLKHRWVILKGICDYVVHAHKSVQEVIMLGDTDLSKPHILGEDEKGFEYFYFPQVTGWDVRIYRQKQNVYYPEDDPLWFRLLHDRRLEMVEFEARIEAAHVREEKSLEELQRSKKKRQNRIVEPPTKRPKVETSHAEASRKSNRISRQARSTRSTKSNSPVSNALPHKEATMVSPRVSMRIRDKGGKKRSFYGFEEEDDDALPLSVVRESVIKDNGIQGTNKESKALSLSAKRRKGRFLRNASPAGGDGEPTKVGRICSVISSAVKTTAEITSKAPLADSPEITDSVRPVNSRNLIKSTETATPRRRGRPRKKEHLQSTKKIQVIEKKEIIGDSRKCNLKLQDSCRTLSATLSTSHGNTNKSETYSDIHVPENGSCLATSRNIDTTSEKETKEENKNKTRNGEILSDAIGENSEGCVENIRDIASQSNATDCYKHKSGSGGFSQKDGSAISVQENKDLSDLAYKKEDSIRKSCTAETVICEGKTSEDVESSKDSADGSFASPKEKENCDPKTKNIADNDKCGNVPESSLTSVEKGIEYSCHTRLETERINSECIPEESSLKSNDYYAEPSTSKSSFELKQNAEGSEAQRLTSELESSKNKQNNGVNENGYFQTQREGRSRLLMKSAHSNFKTDFQVEEEVLPLTNEEIGDNENETQTELTLNEVDHSLKLNGEKNLAVESGSSAEIYASQVEIKQEESSLSTQNTSISVNSDKDIIMKKSNNERSSIVSLVSNKVQDEKVHNNDASPNTLTDSANENTVDKKEILDKKDEVTLVNECELTSEPENLIVKNENCERTITSVKKEDDMDKDIEQSDKCVEKNYLQVYPRKPDQCEFELVASGYEELQQLVEKMEKQIRTSEKTKTGRLLNKLQSLMKEIEPHLEEVEEEITQTKEKLYKEYREYILRESDQEDAEGVWYGKDESEVSTPVVESKKKEMFFDVDNPIEEATEVGTYRLRKRRHEEGEDFDSNRSCSSSDSEGPYTHQMRYSTRIATGTMDIKKIADILSEESEDESPDKIENLEYERKGNSGLSAKKNPVVEKCVDNTSALSASSIEAADPQQPTAKNTPPSVVKTATSHESLLETKDIKEMVYKAKIAVKESQEVLKRFPSAIKRLPALSPAPVHSTANTFSKFLNNVYNTPPNSSANFASSPSSSPFAGSVNFYGNRQSESPSVIKRVINRISHSEVEATEHNQQRMSSTIIRKPAIQMKQEIMTTSSPNSVATAVSLANFSKVPQMASTSQNKIEQINGCVNQTSPLQTNTLPQRALPPGTEVRVRIEPSGTVTFERSLGPLKRAVPVQEKPRPVQSQLSGGQKFVSNNAYLNKELKYKPELPPEPRFLQKLKSPTLNLNSVAEITLPVKYSDGRVVNKKFVGREAEFILKQLAGIKSGALTTQSLATQPSSAITIRSNGLIANNILQTQVPPDVNQMDQHHCVTQSVHTKQVQPVHIATTASTSLLPGSVNIQQQNRANSQTFGGIIAQPLTYTSLQQNPLSTKNEEAYYSQDARENGQLAQQNTTSSKCVQLPNGQSVIKSTEVVNKIPLKSQDILSQAILNTIEEEPKELQARSVQVDLTSIIQEAISIGQLKQGVDTKLCVSLGEYGYYNIGIRWTPLGLAEVSSLEPITFQ
ncbi:uncharacterized protein LOC136033010 isoform X2 [Artemia franciscana]|uniref:Bromo domain-containing protein n=1 Tax=Artemia franciscana TaxID=6661 RepID=A0AA88LIA1_ARTSF|nr:hypothetical protein QYM36_001368 [Artemia franciscana]